MLPTTCCSLLITYYVSLATYYLLLTTPYFLLTTYCSLLPSHYLLLTTHCLLQAALFTDSTIGAFLLQDQATIEDITSLKDKIVLWGHAGVAILILLLAWRAHSAVQPYEYRFQNSIETCAFDLAV